ncbi:amidohydrolase family protein [Streptomyces sp. CB04723]|uniref:amidohydrolase family protein n=1 Tax=Streptomyces sp. CB04723 TaxID=2748873 RepID=UPI00359C3031
MSQSTAPRSAPDHRTVLLRGGDVHSPADPFATAMVVERGHVAWVGSEGAADAFASGVDEVVDLEGALVTPAFTDAHVHTTATGLALTGLDLSAAAPVRHRDGRRTRACRLGGLRGAADAFAAAWTRWSTSKAPWSPRRSPTPTCTPPPPAWP